MHQITLEVRGTSLKTTNAPLARQVLEQETGLAPILGELITRDNHLIPPAIGQHWHGQGGTYVGVIRGEDGQPDYHLVAPAHAQTASIIYGSHGKRIDGANYRRDGLANTKALLASGIEHPAALWASEQETEGHRDLYLPAQAEAFLCWANIPEQFKDTGWWITSTQYGPYYAWIQNFADGTQYYGHKDYARPAFAVRRILIPSTLIALESPRA